MEQIYFIGLSVLTVLSSLGVVLFPHAIYAAFSFFLTMLGTAGIFALFGAQFLALSQVVIYASSLVVIFLFVLLLLNEKKEHFDFLTYFFFVALLVLAGYFVQMIMPKLTVYRDAKFIDLTVTLSSLAEQLDSDLFWFINFEMAAFVLLAAMLAAVSLTSQKVEVPYVK